MIISTTSELNALLPANVSSEASRWLTLMEQTERSYIIPLLGKPLYADILDEYGKLCRGTAVDAQGVMIETGSLLATESDGAGYKYTPMQQLIRLLQVPVVYMTLSNNAGLLAVSLNDGGMNSVSAEGYEAIKKEDREAFARDCYLNAHKGIEQVLLFLEEDAQSKAPVFLSKWMQSSCFYRQNALLLRTAVEFNRFVPIAESRETFLQLVPSIRNVQENRIRPELGDTLLNALIQFQFYGPQPKIESEDTGTESFTKEEHDVCMTSEEAFEEDLRPYLPYGRFSGLTDGERYKLRCWNKALLLVRSAIAYHVEVGNKKLQRPDSHNDAMSNLDRAKSFITGNSAAFEGVIEESPLYESTDAGPEQEPSCCGRLNGKRDAGFIHDPFETFYD